MLSSSILFMRFTSSYLLLVITSLSTQVFGFRQPFEYLKALQAFQAGFLDPAEIVSLKYSPALADDVVGRVDVTTTITGNQLNTEYIYGLWLGVSLDNRSTPIFGTPTNLTIQSLVIEPPVAFLSTIVNLNYSTIDLALPIQIDSIFRFNDELKIVSYDMVFRRWPEAFQYILPKLAQQIAIELNPAPNVTNNATALVALRAATDVCEVALQYCDGADPQDKYESYDECINFLTGSIPFGEIWEGGRNTGWCRYIHKNLVKLRPEVHCANVGPRGGDMCTQRDYINVVDNFPFQSTLIAADASYSSSDVTGLSSSSIEQLLEISMQTVVSTTVAFYSVPTMLLFVFLYCAARAVTFTLARLSHEYSMLSFENQRNTVTYVLNTVFTTVALGFQLAASTSFARIYTYNGTAALKVTATIISALYIFEMSYRPSMRISLLAHHFCTLLAIISLFISLEVTAHPAVITAGLIWLFQATTEQFVFIGLFMYRLRYSRLLVCNILRFAAVQSFIFKFVFAVYLIVWWAIRLARYHREPTDIFLSVIICVIGSLLLVTQVYGTWAVWALASKIKRSIRRDEIGVIKKMEMGHSSTSFPTDDSMTTLVIPKFVSLSTPGSSTTLSADFQRALESMQQSSHHDELDTALGMAKSRLQSSTVIGDSGTTFTTSSFPSRSGSTSDLYTNSQRP